MNGIHWLRPQAFWMLLLLIPLFWFFRRERVAAGRWSQIIDPHLLPYLLVGKPSTKNAWFLSGILLAWILVVIAIAGPSWQQVSRPAFKKDQALVIVLDLSPFMLAEDIKPTRMARVQYKLIDLLRTRKEGQTALVVFSDQPYVVAPLTQDSHTLINFLPALTPELMPAAGQNVDLALQQAEKLITQTSARRGEILLITGGLMQSSALERHLRQMRERGITTTVYGVGTTAGSPIPRPQGGFLKDTQGNIVMAHLDKDSLIRLARAGGGRFITMSNNNDDITVIANHLAAALPWGENDKKAGFDVTVWRDEGHWVVLFILPFFLMLFRRRVRL